MDKKGLNADPQTIHQPSINYALCSTNEWPSKTVWCSQQRWDRDKTALQMGGGLVKPQPAMLGLHFIGYDKSAHATAEGIPQGSMLGPTALEHLLLDANTSDRSTCERQTSLQSHKPEWLSCLRKHILIYV